MKNIDKRIRALAKSFKYQMLYSQSKEINISLFKNNTDFSNLQMLFLYYLSFHYNLVTDYHLGEVDEKVFENDLYEDSYMYYKNKNKDKEKNSTNKNKKKIESPTTQWVFKNKKV